MIRFSTFFLGSLLFGCSHDQELAPTQGPAGSLTLVSPAPAAWMDAGITTARGAAEHIASLSVNGAKAQHGAGTFSAEVELSRGIDLVEAEAIDGRGDTLFARHAVIAGNFSAPEGDVEDAIRLRVNQGVLDKAMDLAAGMLDADTLDASVGAMNPVYSDSYGVWGWDAVTIDADISSVDFGQPQLSVRPDDGTLTLTATLPDLYVVVRAYGDVVGWDFDTDVILEASEAEITGTLTVGARDGHLVVSLDGADVTLRDFSYDTSLLPGDIESYILVDTIRDTLEGMLVENIEAEVPPLLDETLSGLDPSLSKDILGKTFDMGFSFAEVEVDGDGLAMSLDLDVSVPAAGAKVYAGYLSAGEGTPTLDTNTDVAAAISDDLLNRVLFEAWRGGLLDMRLSTDDGTLSPLILLNFKAETGTVTISSDLPPVIVERDGALLAQIGELMVDVQTPGGELGEHIRIAVAANVPLALAIEDGVLALSLGTPEITLVVRESDWGASEETVTRLVEDTLPLDALLVLLGDIEVPIPSLYGIAIDSGAAVRDDDGVHTGVEIWLD